MKKWAMAALCVLFSLMFCFNCLGYAALTANLTIEGTATWTMPEEVFITNVSYDSAIAGKVSTTAYVSSVLTSGVTLSSKSDTVTLEITVYNNTNEVQGLDAVLSEAEFYSNPNITFALTNLSRPVIRTTTTNGVTTTETIPGTQIQPHTSHTFQITFSYHQTDSSVSSLTLDSTLDFVFKPYDEIKPDEESFVIIEGALGRFLEVLNDPTVSAGLAGELDDGMALINPDNFLALLFKLFGGAGEYDYPIVGNVGDSLISSDSADVDYVSELFTVNGKNYLTLMLNGEPINVTALIQGADTDGDGVYDIMMLYLTPENVAGTDTSVAPVYVAFFQNTDDGWVQKGDLYIGKASACRYSTAKNHSSSTLNTYGLGNNSFDPDTWVSDENVSRDDMLKQLGLIQ